MAPYVKIISYPPLGQLTVVPIKQDISFTIVVEWYIHGPPYAFEVLLAHTPSAASKQHESLWPTIPLKRAASVSPHILNAETCQRAFFTTNVKQNDLVSSDTDLKSVGHQLFTIMLRTDAFSPWDTLSVLDPKPPGELIFQQAVPQPINSLKTIDNLNVTSEWNVTSLMDNDTGASTFLLESKSAIPKTEGAELATLPLASLTSVARYFSIVRLAPYWIGARQGRGSFFYISEHALTASFLLDSGLIITFVVLGWVDDVYQVLKSDAQGRIVVGAQNDNDEDKHYRVVISLGLDFDATMASAMDQTRNIISESTKVSSLTNTTKDLVSSVDSATATASNERWLNSLTFCTWNGLGQDLTQTKILTALDQLKKHNIHISTLLIDDNWQTLGPTKEANDQPWARGFSDMEANTTVAPNGLKSLITDIRTQYPNIKDIGVWHALMGYWGCISHTGSIAANYATTDIIAISMLNKPSTVTTIASEALHKFYSDFYAFLRDSGITFVKTDSQHMISTYQDSRARRDLIATYQSAWTCAHLQHFQGKAISCMAQTPQTMFHSLLQTSTPPVVHRNSDDFYPEIPTSHPWHVWVNAHNAVFTRHLNVVPDWDMFQTDHEYSAFHAAARCVSGGPVLITDVPGKHDVDLIAQMTARAPGDGETIVLRTNYGATIDVFGLYNEAGLLKILAGTEGGHGGVLMGLFNVADREIREMVHVIEFGLQNAVSSGEEQQEVLVRGHRTGEMFGPISLSSFTPSSIQAGHGDEEADAERETGKLIHVRLPVRGWDILTAQHIVSARLSSGQVVKYCVLGLLGKMSGAAAITQASSVSIEHDKTVIRIHLKALGKLGVWIDAKDTAGSVDKVRVQGSAVGAEFLKRIVSTSGLHGRGTGHDGSSSSNDTGVEGHDATTKAESTIGGSAASNSPHVLQIDVQAYWEHAKLWGESCKEVVVDVVIG